MILENYRLAGIVFYLASVARKYGKNMPCILTNYCLFQNTKYHQVLLFFLMPEVQHPSGHAIAFH